MKRPRYIVPGDTRPPMQRLLQDCNNEQSGMVEVAYEAQFRTLFKAQRLGYVDAQQRLTDKGRALLSQLEEART